MNSILYDVLFSAGTGCWMCGWCGALSFYYFYMVIILIGGSSGWCLERGAISERQVMISNANNNIDQMWTFDTLVEVEVNTRSRCDFVFVFGFLLLLLLW